MNVLLKILLIMPSLVFSQHDNPSKICIPKLLEESCKKMERDIPDKLSCVVGRDWIDCAQKLNKGEADLANMDIRGVYAAGKYFNVIPIANEITEGGSSQYEGMALVRKESNINSLEDLRGKKSCHTGFGRTVGWHLPLALLASKGVLQPQSCAARSQGSIEFLETVKTFFSGGSCVPGNWSSDSLVDSELKSRFPELCSMCKNPSSCSGNDPYAGYNGVIRCIHEGSGDVAFTKTAAVKDYLKENPSLLNSIELLCSNGSKMELNLDVNGLEECYWGFVPTNAFVTSSEKSAQNREELLKVIEDVQAKYTPNRVAPPSWYHEAFLSSSKAKSAKSVDPSKSDYVSYLGPYFLSAIEGLPCDSSDSADTKWCVTSEEEKQKCEDYFKAATSRALWPRIACVLAVSKAACLELLKNGHANIVNLDGGDIYRAGKYFNLQPVTAEVYGDSDATYFSVAVIRSASDVTKLNQLKGLRSCHTGMGRTAGWIVPVGTLLEDGSIQNNHCDFSKSVADFFSEGSCVPGANDTKYNPGRSHANKLCQQCIGNNERQFKCSRDSKERYSGYAGAFRCLAEGKGDVAFVKHTTVLQYTDENSSDDWSRDLLSSDFQLLCRQGGTATAQNYKNCNLAKVPSHYVVTNSNVSSAEKLKLAKFLADSSKYFGFNSKLFRLFGQYGLGDGQQDLLFKDATTTLKSIPLTSSYVDALGQEFYLASTAVDPKTCN